MTLPDTETWLGDGGNASQLWDKLSEYVDAFLAAWETPGDPPRLAQFVPEGQAALRRLVLTELIKVDLEYRWRNRRAPKLLEAYLEEFPELTTGGSVPCDLIYEEFHVRKQNRDPVDPADYFVRFPRQAAELGRLLGLEAPEASTMLVAGERSQAKIAVGQQLDDFDLLTVLGKGAFATVYLARQRSMQRLVALKVSSDRGSEPQTMAQLDHPHIVRVYDQRQLPERKLRLLYMHYIAGGTLQSVVEHTAQKPRAALSGRDFLAAIDRALERRGESPPLGSTTRHKLEHATWPEAICWLGARLASALAYAHQQGTLHRDVKPANVLVSAEGIPKLADFNISFSSKLDGATPAAYFGGSLAYMSPEQLEACNPNHDREAAELDGRCDAYSLGVLLWELLAGSRPFADGPMGSVWSKTLDRMTALRHAGVAAEAQARLPQNCPPGLKQVLLKCLAGDLGDRYRSAEEFARALDLCLQPRARRLLEPPTSRWGQLPRRWPVLSTVLAGLLPNAVASALNIFYNYSQILRHLTDADRRVWVLQLFGVNAIAYPVGLAAVVYLYWVLFRSVNRLSSGKEASVSDLAVVRERGLTLGDYTAWISAAEWAISGVVFPVWIRLQVGSETGLKADHYWHFIVSQTLCGLIAATLTFFCVTFAAVRVCYPWLVASGAKADEASLLVALGRRIRLYFVLAVSVPFLALISMVVINTDRLAIGALGGVGLAAFGLSYWLETAIRGDLGALATAIDPAGETHGVGAESDSFWTGSR